MKAQFKFKIKTSDADRKNVMEKLMEQGVKNVHPLFPGEHNKELASLYIIEFDDPKIERRIFTLLKKVKFVDFVEPEVKRKLIW